MTHHLLPPGLHDFTIHHAGRPRRYWLQVPSAVTAGAPLPLVLMLHGTGATAAWSRAETRLGEFADAAGFLAAFPEGLPPDPDQPPNFLRNPPRWISLPGADKFDDLGFLAALPEDITRRTPVDLRRVYATGFSNGASMVFRLAAERSKQLAAIAPVAGPVGAQLPRPERAMPTLFLIGTDDPLMPLGGGPVVHPWGTEFRRPVAETLTDWARALGCPLVPRLIGDGGGVRVEVYGPGCDGAELVAYTVTGLGHHWPGGLGQLNPRIAGTPSDRVDANTVIWEFFRRWELPD